MGLLKFKFFQYFKDEHILMPVSQIDWKKSFNASECQQKHNLSVAFCNFLSCKRIRLIFITFVKLSRNKYCVWTNRYKVILMMHLSSDTNKWVMLIVVWTWLCILAAFYILLKIICLNWIILYYASSVIYLFLFFSVKGCSLERKTSHH